MKPVYILTTSWCPHCKNARQILSDLLAERPEWADLSIQIIDEEKEPDQLKPFFNYYYVPTVYVGEDKQFEGVPSRELMEAALTAAYGAD